MHALPAGPASSVAEGWSHGDWLVLVSLGISVFAIVLAILAAHFHSVVRDDAARARLVEKLTAKRARDLYHDHLRGALHWIDRTIDLPPLGRRPNGRRVFGIRSLNVGVCLSIAYSFASLLIGWVVGSQGVFGEVTLLELPNWASAGWLPWLQRVLVAIACLLMWSFLWWWFRTRAAWPQRFGLWLSTRLRLLGRRAFGSAGNTIIYSSGVLGGLFLAGIVVIGLAIASAAARTLADALLGSVAVAFILTIPVAMAGAFALAFASASAIAIVHFGDDPQRGLIFIMFVIVLPWLNGLLDWLSLSVSRWLGRGIVAEWDSPVRLAVTLFLAVLDLVLAVAFAFIVAWLLAFGVEASADLFGLSLGLDQYVTNAAAAPWTTGFWATFMVLSTLIPTAVHLVLACGAVLVAWQYNPLRRCAAERLASGNQADWLWPQLYLTFGWLVPTFAVPLALLFGLAFAFKLFWFDSLPEALRDTALAAIATARLLW